MSEIQIKGERKLVYNVFSADYIFRVPLYQRPYSWTPEHGEALLMDLLEALGEETNIENCEPYFLGSIVLVKAEEKPDADILDGQQRLTTLAILLSVLSQSDGVSKAFAKALKNYLYDEANPVLGREASFRLIIRKQDSQFFKKYIQEDGGLKKFDELHLPDLSDSQRNIILNAQRFIAKVNTLTPKRKEDLVSFIVSRCVLVVVSTPNPDAGFRIFRILNDRGMPLSLPDILKADVIGRIADAEQSDYNKLWEELERELGVESFEELFMQIRMIYRQTRSRDARKEFREHVLSKFEDARVFIDDVLTPYADAYTTIRKASYQGEHHSQIKRVLRWLNRIAHQDWLPPAILIMARYKNKPTQLLELLTALERVAATLFVLNRNVNKRVERYKPILSQFFDSDAGKPRDTVDDAQLKAAMEVSQADQDEAIAKLESDVYENQKACEYVLLRLDYSKSDNPPDYDDMKIITIEHVLPQNPDANSEWRQLFTEDERKNYAHKLGNLILLTKKKNSKCQNFDFTKKKDQYFDKDSYTAFRITQEVKNEIAWTPDVVRQRQANAVNKLQEVWKLQKSPVTTASGATRPH